MTTKPVAVRVSQATRLVGSSDRHASRIASEIWSAILSGCPSVTDSEVNRVLCCAIVKKAPCENRVILAWRRARRVSGTRWLRALQREEESPQGGPIEG